MNRNGEILAERPPLQDARLRRGGVLRPLAVLALAVLALSAAEGTRPAAAQGDNQTTQGLSAAALQARQDRIRQFFDARLQGMKIVATTVTPSGQTLDWIRPETQTVDGTLATPPGEPITKNPGTTERPELGEPGPTWQVAGQARTEVQMYPSIRGPVGTVPVVRFDVEKYLAGVAVPPSDPQDVLRELANPAPDATGRYYVVWRRDGTAYGTAGQINIWDVDGPFRNNNSVPKDTSIAQAAVTRGTPLQSVEAGKVESAQVPGMQGPTFFVAYTTNGYTMNGNWLGGTNTLSGAGFIQYSAFVAPGMSLAVWASADGGNQYDLDFRIHLWQGNWWIKAAGVWVGYYPFCVGGGSARPCPNGTLFSENGLRDQASRLEWYGEVFDAWAPAPTSTDMGSGKFASARWQHAAYFRNLVFFWDPMINWWFNSGTLIVTDAQCYSGHGPFYSTVPQWRNWFYFGGPGAEGPHCR